MVLKWVNWFLKGKIDIVIPRTTYNYGETVEGKVILELKKPQKGKGVFIELNKKELYTVRQGRKNVPKSHILYNKISTLSIEKEYPSGKSEYPFQFTIPDKGGSNNSSIFENMRASVGKNKRITWYLSAKLEVSGFDVNREVILEIHS